MRQLIVKPQIFKFDTGAQFVEAFEVGEGDLILTNQFIFDPFFKAMNLKADVIFQEKYGSGEPSDEMAQAILADMKGPYKRIIGIGGGTILDISKLFALKDMNPVVDLFDKKIPVVRDKELVLVPTTCGTGSEVTNVSVMEIKSRQTKMGLAVDDLYADSAVLIPELLTTLPYRFFAMSSIDALIHAVESSVSPKGTDFTRLFGYKAIELIIKGYQVIAQGGEDARLPLLDNFLKASCYAGVAFGNAGTGLVHALTYPLSGKYHVPHGEANYIFFTHVFEHYMKYDQGGELGELNKLFASLLNCDVKDVYVKLEELLSKILTRKPLHEYGMTEEDILPFTKNVIEQQTRLTQNSFVLPDYEQVETIFRALM